MTPNTRLRPILLAALTAMGFLLVIALFGVAISVSILPNLTMPLWAAVPIAFLALAILLIAYAIAGITSCAFAGDLSTRGHYLYPLGTWALLTCAIAVPAILMTASLGLDLNIKPRIVTDMNVMKAYAVTTVQLSSPSEKKEEEPAKNRAMILIAWVSFLSVALGAPVAILSARTVERRRWLRT